MGKALVVCIDGTWNDSILSNDRSDPMIPEERQEHTNVALTWLALTSRSDAQDQSSGLSCVGNLTCCNGEAIYIRGVGTGRSWFSRGLLGGATGWGTPERVKEAYDFLATRYEPGDHIYGFGFSRGAYAVRSLAGLVNAIGLPSVRRVAGTAADDYFNGSWRQTRPAGDPFHFLGIWDTVDAHLLNDQHDPNPTNVRRVAHALSADEQRAAFNPMLWTGSKQVGTHLDEVWFSGAHTNVGGGYSDPGLAYIGLFWVLKAAREAGLNLQLNSIDGYFKERPLGAIHDSAHEFAKGIPRKLEQFGIPRIDAILAKLRLNTVPRNNAAEHQRVHASVLDRIGADASYKPVAVGLQTLAVEEWGFDVW